MTLQSECHTKSENITIKLLNFRCHNLKIYQFPIGSISLLSGKSGSGKTTVLMAFLWCLYGGLRGDALKPLKTSFKKTCEMDKISQSNFYEEFKEYGAGPSATAVSITFPNFAIIVRKAAASCALTVKLLNENSTILKGDSATDWIIKNFGSRSVWNCGSYLAQNSQNQLLSSSSFDRFQILYDMTFGDVSETDASPDAFIKKITDALTCAKISARNASSELAMAKDHHNTIIKEFGPESCKVDPSLFQTIEECDKHIKIHEQQLSAITNFLNDFHDKNSKLESLKAMLNNKQKNVKARELSLSEASEILERVSACDENGDDDTSKNKIEYDQALTKIVETKSLLDSELANIKRFDSIQSEKVSLESKYESLKAEKFPEIDPNNFKFPTIQQPLVDVYLLGKSISQNPEEFIASTKHIEILISNLNMYQTIGTEMWSDLKKLYESSNLKEIVFSDIARLLESISKHHRFHHNNKNSDDVSQMQLDQKSSHSSKPPSKHFENLILVPDASKEELLVAKSLRQAISDSGKEHITIGYEQLTMDSLFCIEGKMVRSVKIIGPNNCQDIADGDNTKCPCDEEDCQLFDDLVQQNVITDLILKNMEYIVSCLNLPHIAKHRIIPSIDQIDASMVICNIKTLSDCHNIMIQHPGKTPITEYNLSQKIDECFQEFNFFKTQIEKLAFQLSNFKLADLDRLKKDHYDANLRMSQIKNQHDISQNRIKDRIIAEQNFKHAQTELKNLKLEIKEIENAIANIGFANEMFQSSETATKQRESHQNMIKKLTSQKSHINANTIVQKAIERLENATATSAYAISKEMIADMALSGVVEGAVSAIQKTCDSISTATNIVLSYIFDDPIEISLLIEKSGRAGIATAGHKVSFNIKYRNSEYDGASLLSGGETDRLSFALAIASSFASTSRIFLIDEALASLGESMRERVIDSIRTFLVGKTVINVCHGVPFGSYDHAIQIC